MFSVRVTLRNFAQLERQRELDLLVDTGSTFTWAPAPVLEEMGIVPIEARQFQTISGGLIERKLGSAVLAWNGRTGPIYVVFAEPGDMTVLGVTALKTLTVTADPIRQVLAPTVALAV